EIGFEADQMIRDLVLVRFAVGVAAPDALFLVGPGDDAHGVARALFARQVGDEFAGRHGDGNAGAVVNGTGAQVPGIQVAADQYHLARVLAAGDFGDDVLAGVFTALTGAEVQLDRDRLAFGQHVFEDVGIGVRERGAGNLPEGDVIAEHAGVRRA